MQARGRDQVIPLTTTEGRLVDVQEAEIEEVRPLGGGAVVYLTGSAPIRVMQSANLTAS